MPTLSYSDNGIIFTDEAEIYIRPLFEKFPSNIGHITIDGIVYVQCDTHPGHASVAWLPKRGTVEIPGGITTHFPKHNGAQVQTKMGSYVKIGTGLFFTTIIQHALELQLEKSRLAREQQLDELKKAGWKMNDLLLAAVLAVGANMTEAAGQKVREANKISTAASTAGRTRLFAYSRAK